MLIRYLAALIAGACLPLAFAPFSIWPVVIFSPALLIYQLTFLRNPKSVFLLGLTFGIGYFGLGISWIYHSLHVFGHAPAVVAGALTLLMILVLSSFIGAVLMLYQRIHNRYQNDNVLWVLPILWFSMEWIKGSIFTGLPWLSLGYAHIDSPLSGFAPLIGVYGLSSLSLVISVALVMLAIDKKITNLIPILLIVLPGFLLQTIDWTKPHGQPLLTTMIQGNIAQELKWRPEQRQNILNTYWNATRENLNSDLIVWPEVAIPGRKDELEEVVLNPLSEHMKATGSHLLTGILTSDHEKGGYYNSMILLGENQGSYHKRHLVPFGEYYPFRELLEFMKKYIRIPRTDTLPGSDDQPLMSVKGNKLGISICYEDVFSRDINNDLPEANILINTSNDAWFGDSLAPHQHLEIAQMRSLETQRPMARATNTGKSAFIDYKGNILQQSDQFKEQALTLSLQGRSGATPFIGFALFQPWLSMIILMIGLFVGFRSTSAKEKAE